MHPWRRLRQPGATRERPRATVRPRTRYGVGYLPRRGGYCRTRRLAANTGGQHALTAHQVRGTVLSPFAPGAAWVLAHVMRATIDSNAGSAWRRKISSKSGQASTASTERVCSTSARVEAKATPGTESSHAS